MVAKLEELKVTHLKHVLIVTEDATVFKSAGNLPYVETSKANSLSVEALIKADVMILSQASLAILEGKAK